MAKREFNGKPIDLTDGIGESHISQRNGKTEGGTTEDDLGDESAAAWPSNLDREEFTDLQQRVIEKWCMMPNAKSSSISKALGVSQTSPYNVKHKLSAMGHHNDVPFEIPANPTESVKAARPYIDSGEDTDEQSGKDSEGGDSKHSDEIIQELYEQGVEVKEISERVDIAHDTVTGKIGAWVGSGKIQRPDAEDESDTEDESVDTAEKTPEEPSNSPDPKPTPTDEHMVTMALTTEQIISLMENKSISQEVKEQIVNSGF